MKVDPTMTHGIKSTRTVQTICCGKLVKIARDSRDSSVSWCAKHAEEWMLLAD